MAGNILPIIAVGAAAVLLSKKKKKKKAASAIGEQTQQDIKELVERTRPGEGPGMVIPVVEETSLDFEEKPSGEEAGDFDIENEDLGYDAEDDVEEAEKAPALSAHDTYAQMRQKCDTFIDTVHVVPTEADEMSINKIAVEQSILPAMRQSALGFAQNIGTPLDGETVGPMLVLAGLEAIAPECGWEFSEAEQEFRYADGKRADGGRMGEVLNAMIDLSVFVLDEVNQPQPPQQEPQIAQFQQG